MPDHGEATCTPSDIVVNVALTARIETLEAENCLWKAQQSTTEVSCFRIENVAADDSLVRWLYKVCDSTLLFYFLGPSVHKLTYWGSCDNTTSHRCRKKLDPLNQLFLTVVKLTLNLRVKDPLHANLVFLLGWYLSTSPPGYTSSTTT